MIYNNKGLSCFRRKYVPCGHNRPVSCIVDQLPLVERTGYVAHPYAQLMKVFKGCHLTIVGIS